MDADERRIAEARARNLEYIRRLDETKARKAADAYLHQHSELENSSEPRRKPTTTGTKNTSVYISGLTTYTACKQLEGVCAKIGKVRRIKFYQDDRGGLKGDALVTFASHNMMLRAIERLNHLEIKPGVLLTATEAQFGSTKESTLQTPAEKSQSHEVPAAAERLFNLEVVQSTITTTTDEFRPHPDADQTDKSTSELSLPSRSVILNHVWDPLAPQDDATQFFTELEDDMRHECSKHGGVDHVHILPTGGVMIRYETLAGAIKCLQVMHGRWFDGRQIDARFDPSTPEEPEDDATKLDAFFASIGSRFRLFGRLLLIRHFVTYSTNLAFPDALASLMDSDPKRTLAFS